MPDSDLTTQLKVDVALVPADSFWERLYNVGIALSERCDAIETRLDAVEARLTALEGGE